MSADLIKAKELCDAEDYAGAHKLCEAALKFNPHNPVALDILATVLIRTEQFGLAYHVLNAIRGYRDDPDIWHNLAACLDHENPDTATEAIHWLEKSLEAGGDVASTLCELALVHTGMREPDKAIHFAEQALKINPEATSAKWNASLALLMKQDWRRGWEWYDEIIGRHANRPPLMNFAKDGPPTPMWDGEGGTVVVSSEQGLGDEIMFASIVPDAIRHAETLILQCDKRLQGLYRRSFPRAIVTPRLKGRSLWLPEPREITHTIPIGSLGRLFRNRAEEFTGRHYLKADPERCLQWRALLDTLPGKKIGIMWQGGVADTGETRRSLTLVQLAPILTLPGFSFVSLNHRPGAEEEIEKFSRSSEVRLHHWKRAHTDDYDDTAALVNELDAVVTVTSTIAHISGALGKRTHVLVPAKPQWRYGISGNRLPWYESVKLYRQANDGDWSQPIAQVKERLAGWQ